MGLIRKTTSGWRVRRSAASKSIVLLRGRRRSRASNDQGQVEQALSSRAVDEWSGSHQESDSFSRIMASYPGFGAAGSARCRAGFAHLDARRNRR